MSVKVRMLWNLGSFSMVLSMVCICIDFEVMWIGRLLVCISRFIVLYCRVFWLIMVMGVGRCLVVVDRCG